MAYVVDPGGTNFTLTNYHYNNDTGWISFDIILESIPYEFSLINGVQLYHGLFDEDYNPAVDPWSHWSGTELGWSAEHNPTSANFTINNMNGSSGTGLLGTMSLHDTYMVFVNTSLEVALQRNKNRERVLPEELVTKSWKDVQTNLGKFQNLFGGNFRIVDNTVYKPVSKEVVKAAQKFMRKPVYNKIGQKWIENAKALKKAGYIKK